MERYNKILGVCQTYIAEQKYLDKTSLQTSKQAFYKQLPKHLIDE